MGCRTFLKIWMVLGSKGYENKSSMIPIAMHTQQNDTKSHIRKVMVEELRTPVVAVLR